MRLYTRLKLRLGRKRLRQYRDLYENLHSCAGLATVVQEEGSEFATFKRYFRRAFNIMHRMHSIERLVARTGVVVFCVAALLAVFRTYFPSLISASALTGALVGMVTTTMVATGLMWRRIRQLRGTIGLLPLIFPLITLSGLLEKRGYDLGSTSTIGPMLSSLEDCAKHVERRSYSLRSGDRKTDKLIRDDARMVAARFRSWKIWILKPGPLTRGDLTYRVNLSIFAAFSSDWHVLSRIAQLDGDTEALKRRSVSAVIAPLAPILVALTTIILLRVSGIQVDSILALALLLPAIAVAGVLAGPSTLFGDAIERSTSIIEKLGLK